MRTRRFIGIYYLFRATMSAGFYVPVAILYLRDQGYGLDFVGYAYAVFAVASVAAEVPTGYVGDWLGRRGSLAAGAGLRIVALAGYPLAGSAGAYLALHVVWAAGRAFNSGTVDAWLYELLAADGATDEYARTESRGSTLLLVTSAVTAVLGGALYAVSPGLPFYANAALAAAGLPVLAVAADGQRRTADCDPDAPDCTATFTPGDAVRMLRVQARRPAVRWLVLYLSLFAALFAVTRVYEQPALRTAGLPVASLGLLYAAFKLVSAGAAASVGWLEARLGARGVFGLLVPAYGLAYTALALAPALVIPVLFLNRGLRTVVTPVRNQYLNDRLPDVGRATVLSGAAMALGVAGAGARVVAGTVVAGTGPIGLYAVAGPVVAVAAAVLWLAVSPVRGERGRPQGTATAVAD